MPTFSFSLLFLAILSRVRCNSKVVLVCMSPRARDVSERYSSAICIPSFENFLFSSLLHFLIGWLSWHLVFYILCIFQTPTLCHMCSWRRCFPILLAATLLKWWHPLLDRHLSVSWDPNCYLLLLVSALPRALLAESFPIPGLNYILHFLLYHIQSICLICFLACLLVCGKISLWTWST